MTSVLVSGSLYRAPEQRTTKAGKPFVVATLKAQDGENVSWWKILAFSESVQAELLRLKAVSAHIVSAGIPPASIIICPVETRAQWKDSG